MTVTIPIKTVSEANAHQHWRHRQARAKEQRRAVALLLPKKLPPLPVRVTLVRLAPRELDMDDNLSSSMKALRDEVAAAYGVSDRAPCISFLYAQERSKDYGVRIHIDGDGGADGGPRR